ncbi:hypothetical protein BH18ACT15_BH18ACT15_14620 [soil metagenome]
MTATVHPSSILRASDDQARAQALNKGVCGTILVGQEGVG